MSLSVCLSACMSGKFHGQTSPNSLSVLTVVWSFSGGVAIRYVLPVLWMTLCFHRMHCVARYGDHNQAPKR